MKNSLRKNRIKEFADDDHEVMSDYYDILESEKPAEEVMKEMLGLIEKDKYFFDPYVVAYQILTDLGQDGEAAKILKDGYRRAVMKIADQDGNWPETMEWGYLENRHLMRIIEQYGLYCWKQGESEQALDIFRRMLRANPGDNQGMRHYILAIRLGLEEDKWYKPFQAKKGNRVIGLKAGELSDWFDKNAEKFPEEFEWLFKIWDQDDRFN